VNRKKLTIAEERFCLHLVEHHSPEQAFMHAYGYSNRTHGYTCVDQEVKKPHVQARILELRADLEQRTAIGRERVAAELGNIGFQNISDYLDHDGENLTLKALGQLTREQSGAIKGITQDKDGRIKLEFYDKISALRDLAKLMGWTQETTVNATQYVIMAPPVTEDEQAFERAALRQIEGTAIEVPEE
jgi:Terminase small subunit